MKTKSAHYLVKDYLVSSDDFEVNWNNDKQRAETKIPSGTDLNKYYQSKDYVSHKKAKTSLEDHIYFLVQQIMHRFKKGVVKRHSSDKKLLDYGAGTGNFARFMSDNAYKVYAVESNSRALIIAANKGLTVFSDLKEVSFKVRFNVISLWHVLEHVSDLENTLLSLRSRLEKNGKLFVAVPNFKSYDSQYYNAFWAALDVPRHLWHFTTPGVQMLMDQSGFKMVAKYPLWFDALYISYLSEQHLGSRWPIIRGFYIGLISNIKAFFSGEYSSLIYVFEEKPSFSED